MELLILHSHLIIITIINFTSYKNMHLLILLQYTLDIRHLLILHSLAATVYSFFITHSRNCEIFENRNEKLINDINTLFIN